MYTINIRCYIKRDTICKRKKSKAILVTARGGIQGCETLRISVRAGRANPQGYLLVLISIRGSVNPQGHSAAVRNR
jgi:hypothetical protein